MSPVSKPKLISFLLRYMLLSVKFTCYKSLPERLSKASGFNDFCTKTPNLRMKKELSTYLFNTLIGMIEGC